MAFSIRRPQEGLTLKGPENSVREERGWGSLGPSILDIRPAGSETPRQACTEDVGTNGVSLQQDCELVRLFPTRR